MEKLTQARDAMTTVSAQRQERVRPPQHIFAKTEAPTQASASTSLRGGAWETNGAEESSGESACLL